MATRKVRRPWREYLKVHPSADVFPLLKPEELKELAADIRKEGLLTGVTLYQPKGGKGGPLLIDGRNRLDAVQANGIEVIDENGRLDRNYVGKTEMGELGSGGMDVAAFVISTNIARRHIATAGQRARLAVKAKLADEEWKRQLAADGTIPRNLGRKMTPTRGSAPGFTGEVAKLAGVNPHRVTEVIAIVNDPELDAKVESGEMTINAATLEARRRSRPVAPPNRRSTTVTYLGDAHVAEALKSLRKASADTLSKKGWAALDRLQEVLSALYDSAPDKEVAR